MFLPEAPLQILKITPMVACLEYGWLWLKTWLQASKAFCALLIKA
jgi:hypothetical protein